MKILAIIGSPRKKGNTYKLVKDIEKKLLGLANDINFEYLFLSDVNLEMCKGCFNCISKGENLCPINDDRELIEKRILGSDGVILSSPGYMWNVSALMKNFMDRIAYSMHRPKFLNQISMLVVTSGGSGIDQALNSLSINLGGSNIVSKLGIMSPPFIPTQKYKNKIEKDTNKAVGKFYQALYKKDTMRPTMGNLIYFKMFKEMAFLSPDKLSADYEYYKDKGKFFYETKVSKFKDFMANIVLRLINGFMKKNFAEFKNANKILSKI